MPFSLNAFVQLNPYNSLDAKRATEFLFRCALAHLIEGKREKIKHELYRIFFYDCPPLDKKLHNPISKKSIDFSKSKEAIFRNEFHELLKSKRKTALRLGHLTNETPWTIKQDKIELLLKGKIQFDELSETDVMPNVRQKGVDLRVAVDISSLAMKHQVKQIVLIAGDADFIPAAKMARREGIDFIVDPMWGRILPSLHEHIDGLRSTCPKPKTNC